MRSTVKTQGILDASLSVLAEGPGPVEKALLLA